MGWVGGRERPRECGVCVCVWGGGLGVAQGHGVGLLPLVAPIGLLALHIVVGGGGGAGMKTDGLATAPQNSATLFIAITKDATHLHAY